MGGRDKGRGSPLRTLGCLQTPRPLPAVVQSRHSPQEDGFMAILESRLGSPKAKPETWAWAQVLYLGAEGLQEAREREKGLSLRLWLVTPGILQVRSSLRKSFPRVGSKWVKSFWACLSSSPGGQGRVGETLGKP